MVRVSELACPSCGARGRFSQEVEVTDSVTCEVRRSPDGKIDTRIVGYVTPEAVDPDVVTCDACGADHDVDDLMVGKLHECRSCGFCDEDPAEHDDAACWYPDVHPIDPVFARTA